MDLTQHLLKTVVYLETGQFLLYQTLYYCTVLLWLAPFNTSVLSVLFQFSLDSKCNLM